VSLGSVVGSPSGVRQNECGAFDVPHRTHLVEGKFNIFID